MPISSYSDVMALGHKAVPDSFWEGTVYASEKLDGSQISWMADEEGLHVKAKKAILSVDAPEKMFAPALATIKRLYEEERLCLGSAYRAEAVCKPKHNALAYERAANGGLVLYDIDRGNQDYAPQDEVRMAAALFGIDFAPVLAIYTSKPALAELTALLDMPSVLGGQIEGVCLKNYCATPETLTLTADLDWVPIGDLVEGNQLLAFSEDSQSQNRYHRYVSSTVQVAYRDQAEVLEIELSDGSRLRCTEDHPILLHPAGKSQLVWREAKDIRGNEAVPRFLRPWKHDRSYEAGYLRGFFDGEGSIIHHQLSLHWGVLQVTFAQKPGVVLDTVHSYLQKLGFECNGNLVESSGVMSSRLLGGKAAAMAFLGSIRPERLYAKFDIDKLGGFKSQYTDRLGVVAVRAMGRQEIVRLQTSSGTYFTGGIGSHNSAYGRDKKVVMAKLVRPEFAEVNKHNWKEQNPGRNDVIERIIAKYKTEARWQKAVQHLREEGKIQGMPEDIPVIMREVQADVLKEEREEIAEDLFEHFWKKDIARGVTRGVPDWWKQRLAGMPW